MKTTLIIFGITGDLGRRKLLPALKHIYFAGKGDELSIIGVSRRAIDVSELLRASLGSDELASHIQSYEMDLTDSDAYVALRNHLDLHDDEQALFYLSVPPNAARQIVTFLGKAGLTTPNVKIMMEKPFGFDVESAEEIISQVRQYYEESQILRVDHYLAKEMAQNIVALRGANAIFRHMWNQEYVSSIEITAAESLDIEGRVQFYEQTGGLRDVLQGHLMQLAALTLMHIPDHFGWSKLAEARLAAFETLEVADPTRAVLGQYAGYRDEVDNDMSRTETFVSLELRSRDPRWLDVPIRLTTGKALAQKYTTIVINLREYKDAEAAKLAIRVQPHEGMSLDIYIKKPGYEYELSKQTLDFSFEHTVDRMPDAYEQVFVDAIRGERDLFATSDEVLRAWEIVAPIQEAVEKRKMSYIEYPKGSSVDAVLQAAMQPASEI